MWYRTLTDEELLRYAEIVTELEKELLKRFEAMENNLREELEEALVEVRAISDNYDALQEDYEDLERENSYLQDRVEELEEKLASLT